VANGIIKIMTEWAEKLKDLLNFLVNLVNCKFTGCIELHFNQGTIAGIKKIERIK